MAKFVLDKIENIVGKEENAGYHDVFKRLFFQVRQKSGLCGRVSLLISFSEKLK